METQVNGLYIYRERERLELTCCGVHRSRLTDLTREIWTPSPLWSAAHRKQRKIPKDHDVHEGPRRRQSKQTPFSLKL